MIFCNNSKGGTDLKSIIILFFLTTAQLFSQIPNKVIFSEIMFNPQSGNNEFIELYNPSTNDTVDLKNFRIKYYNSQPNNIISAGFGTKLLPKSYAVIFQNDYDLLGGIYNSIFKEGSLILKIKENFFGSSGMANTVDRPLWLLNAFGDTLDYYLYSANNDKGISDEKINMFHIGLDSNWKNSLVQNGTPGFLNSVSPRESDLILKDIIFNPPAPVSMQNVEVQLLVLNNGIYEETFYCEVFEDTDLDSLPNNLVTSTENLKISAGKSLIISLNYLIESIQKQSAFYARIICKEDQDNSNNSFYKIVPIGFTFGSVIINEIMYEPDIDNCEFIEFFNNTGKLININGWKIVDEKQNEYILSNLEMFIPSNSYFVLGADSIMINKYSLQDYPYKKILGIASLGLTNNGKLIILKDLYGNTIDSVCYNPDWHNKNYVSTKNISLERINTRINGNDSFNWSSSVSSTGATPSKQNSIFSINKNTMAKISISPNPFSPDNDGFEDFSIINYSLAQNISQIRVKIFDSRGRLVRTLLNNQPSGSNGSIIFNGLDDEGNPLRIGIYIVFLEAINSKLGTIETLKKAIVVARKLN